MARMKDVRVGHIAPYPGLNTRRHFDEQKLQDLAASIRANGLLQPLVLHESENGDLLLIAGERRLRACRLISEDLEVPCTIKRYTEQELVEIMISENLQREDLTPVEEARAFRRALMLPGMTQKALAERVGVSQPYVSNRIRLLDLPEDLLELIEEGALDPSIARDLLLPFTKIPEKKRAKLFSNVIKELRQYQRHGDLKELARDDFEDIVVGIARDLSLPVDAEAANYNEEKPLFAPKEHQACTCNGPAMRYGWNDTKGVRCFNEKWWKAAQQAARQREEEKAKRAAERAQKAGKAAESATRMSEEAFRRAFGETYRFRIDDGLLDAAELADAQLVVVTSRYGGDCVCCTDQKALRRARSVVTREERKLLEEKRAERGRKLREQAEQATLEPWMLAQILISRPFRDSQLETAREIGIDIGKHGDQHNGVSKLSAADIELFFKALAFRYMGSDSEYFHDRLQQQVRETIRKRYAPGVAALLRRAKATAKLEAQAVAV